MYAIIPAGGKGTRLGALTQNQIPKPMIRIHEKPVLHHIMEGLEAYGVGNFVIAKSHLGGAIVDYFGNGSRFGIKITYIESSEEMGALGAIRACLEAIPDEETQTYVVGADIISDVDYSALREQHEESRSLGFMPLLTPVIVPDRFGAIENISLFPDTPSYFSRNHGKLGKDCLIWFAETELKKFIPQYGELSHINELPTGDQNAAFIHRGYFRDIGQPSDYQAAASEEEYEIWKPSSVRAQTRGGNLERR